jgi:hypothetical protein
MAASVRSDAAIALASAITVVVIHAVWVPQAVAGSSSPGDT